MHKRRPIRLRSGESVDVTYKGNTVTIAAQPATHGTVDGVWLHAHSQFPNTQVGFNDIDWPVTTQASEVRVFMYTQP